MTVTELAPDEQLSPELVLVLPHELRARVLASLDPPVWPAPRKHVPAAPPSPRLRVVEPPPVLAPEPPPPPRRSVPEVPPVVEVPFVRALGGHAAARLAQLVAIFVVVTVVTLAMSLVAHAVR
jgi:hypothetical protein